MTRERRSAISFFVVALLSGLTTVRPASAQQAPTVIVVVCEKEPRCSKKVLSAIKQAETNRQAALDAIQDAYNDYHDPRLCYNLGRLHQQLQQLPEAAEQYRRFLESGVESRPERLIKARTYLEQVERELAALRESAGKRAPESSPPTSSAASPEGPPAPILSPTSGPSDKRPIYKKWWFWTALGGTLAVSGLAIGLGVAYGRPSVPSDWPRFSY